MTQIYFLKNKKALIIMLITIVLFNSNLFSQTNIDVSSATTINTFPHTELNINTTTGDIATGMNGTCNAIPCCNVLYYRLEIPSNGDLTVINDNFNPLAGSIIAYTSNVPNPTNNSDLTFVVDPGNFCGFRDTLTLTGLVANSVYYILLFNHNAQVGLGAISSFNFTFTPDGTLGVEEYENTNTIKLFPNPTTEYIQILGLKNKENYSIYNVIGTEISKGNISIDEKIDVKNYSNGLYFLKFENGNTIKFMKE